MTNLFIEGFHLKSKDGVQVDIPINAKVTIITGFSATGKTKMINFLSDILNTHQIAECNVQKDDIVVIKDMQSFKILLNAKDIHDKVIFIDKFDLTDFSKSIPFLEKSHNYFIICAHRRLRKCGWEADSILEMIHDGLKYAPQVIKKQVI